MTNPTQDISLNKTARIAGFWYFMTIPFGVFGIIYASSYLVVSGDAAATAKNVIENGWMFRLSIVSALLTQIVTVLAALFLYKLLKPVHKGMASIMVLAVSLGAPIAMLNEINHFAVLVLLGGANYLTAFSLNQLYAQVMFFFDLHTYGVLIAQIFWGLWLFPMGYLVFKSNFFPKVLGVLLMIACVGYVTDSLVFFLIPRYHDAVSQFALAAAAIGEFAFIPWLLIKGVRR